MDSKHRIAKRAAAFFKEGDVVNLGIGLPDLCAAYAPPGVTFHTDTGLLGVGPPCRGPEKDKDFFNASGEECTWLPGASTFDAATAFAIVRSGRLDATVLGGLQVSELGDLSNWATPGRFFGMGGAMDLVSGAKKVIVAMEHCTKDGRPKILKECTLPYTGHHCVSHIVTELCVIDVTQEGLLLREVAPGLTAADVQKKTQATLIVAADLKEMDL